MELKRGEHTEKNNIFEYCLEIFFEDFFKDFVDIFFDKFLKLLTQESHQSTFDFVSKCNIKT